MKDTGARRRKKERIDSNELFLKLMEIVSLYGGMIRLTILKNGALLSYSLLTLFSGARGGNGWFSKAALARCLPLDIGPRERERRLYRFLSNPRVTPEAMIPLHVVLACGLGLSTRAPLILDQTTIRGIQTLLIGLVFSGRVLPLAFSCFTNDKIRKSRNALEHGLILAVMACFPPGAQAGARHGPRVCSRLPPYPLTKGGNSLFDTCHFQCHGVSSWKYRRRSAVSE